jgi:hypothetical protein
MNHTIRGSDVFVKEDLRSMFDTLTIVARHQPAGEFRDGFLAAVDAMRTAANWPPLTHHASRITTTGGSCDD